MGKRRYKVVGEDDHWGHEPGEVFDIEYRDGVLVRPGGFEYAEDSLIKRGILEKVKRGVKATEKTEEKKDDAGDAEK